MNKIYIFDIDGTLTPSRRRMTEDFAKFFDGWSSENTYYLVTGKSPSISIFDSAIFSTDFSCPSSSCPDSSLSLSINLLATPFAPSCNPLAALAQPGSLKSNSVWSSLFWAATTDSSLTLAGDEFPFP